MKVYELIQELSKYPADKNVIINTQCGMVGVNTTLIVRSEGITFNIDCVQPYADKYRNIDCVEINCDTNR